MQAVFSLEPFLLAYMHYARDYRTLHGQHPGIAVISVIMFPKYNRLPHEP